MQREIAGKQGTENMHFLACQLILVPPVPLARMKKSAQCVFNSHTCAKSKQCGHPDKRTNCVFFSAEFQAHYNLP